ncbi:unnamed protein product [Discosporangium mesarthrocarpum]
MWGVLQRAMPTDRIALRRSGWALGWWRVSTRPTGRFRTATVDQALGLKAFMHRTRVLGLYRGMLKRARAMGETTRNGEISQEVRKKFRSSQTEDDPLKIRMMVADAEQHLEYLQGASRGAPKAGNGPQDSWLDIDDTEDQRGRVGVGFPWER